MADEKPEYIGKNLEGLYNLARDMGVSPETAAQLALFIEMAIDDCVDELVGADKIKTQIDEAEIDANLKAKRAAPEGRQWPFGKPPANE